MKREYEDIIRNVCCSDWRRLRDAKGTGSEADIERKGAVGVACLLSYLRGVDANIDDMCRHLDLTRDEVYEPFMRLIVNRVFARSKNDASLTGTNGGNEWISGSDSTRNAWAYVAGIASGFTGLVEDNVKRNTV